MYIDFLSYVHDIILLLNLMYLVLQITRFIPKNTKGKTEGKTVVTCSAECKHPCL